MKRLITLGIRDGLPVHLKGKIILTNQIAIGLFLVGFIFAIASFAFLPIVRISVAGITILCSTVFLFNYLGYHNISRIIISLLPPFALSLIHATIVQTNEPLITSLTAGYICISMIPFLIFDLQERMLLAPIMLVYWIIYLLQGNINQWVDIPLDSSIYYDSSITLISHIFNICIVSFGLILFQLKNHKIEKENRNLVLSLREQKEKLALQNDLIAKQHKEIVNTNTELEKKVDERAGALKKSEKQLSIIYNNVKVYMGLFGVKEDGRFILESINKPYLELFQSVNPEVTEDQLIGLDLISYFDFISSYSFDKTKIAGRVATFNKMVNEKVSTEYEGKVSIFNDEASSFYYSTKLTPVLNEKGDCTHILFVSEDISKQKSSELELQTSEAHSKTLFEYSPIIIWEEDFSAVKNYFDSLTVAEMENLPTHFEQNPAELERLATMIKVKDVNQKSVDFYNMESKEKHITELPFYFVEESWEVLKAEFIALARGATTFESEIPIKTLDAKIVYLMMNLSIPPEHKNTWESVLVSFIDITERKQARLELEYRFKFEQLLTKVSSEFINLPLQDIDASINNLLRQLCEFMNFDRSFIILISKENNTSSTRFEWAKEGIPNVKENFQNVPLDTYPSLIERLRNKESLIVKNLDDIPENLIKFKADIQKLGISSLIHVPMMWEGELIGFIGFDSHQEKGHFPEDLEVLLRFAGEMITNVLQRQKGELALITNEHRLSTIYNSSQDFIGLIRRGPGGTYKVESANQPSIDLLTRLGLISNPDDLLELDAELLFQNVFRLDDKLVNERMKMLEQVVVHNKTIKFTNVLAPLSLKSQILFETVLSPVFGPQGDCTHILLSSKDITESQIAKNKIISSQKRLASVYNSAKDQMAIIDVRPDGELYLEDVNQSFMNSWTKAGYKWAIDDFIGKSMAFYLSEVFNFSEAEIKERYAFLNRTIIKKKPHNFEEPIIALNKGKYILDVSVSPILNEEDVCTKLLMVIRDITLKHRAKEKIISKILETEDRERSRFAKELHDGLGQNLTAASLNFNLVKKSIQQLSPDIQQKFFSGNKFLKEAIDESRNIAHNLMPQSILDFGYVLTIESLLESLNQSMGIEFTFYDNLEGQRLPIDLELSLYRITQEATNNILKHAEATEAIIQLIKHSKSVILTVEDNGKGFDASEHKTPNFGLNSMKNRVNAHSGVLDIDSTIGKGTSITLEIPVIFALQTETLQLSD